MGEAPGSNPGSGPFIFFFSFILLIFDHAFLGFTIMIIRDPEKRG